MAYRNYAPANGFIVSKDGNGDFSTIQTAITAATSGTTIFIKPGTYTENLTLKAGVNLTAFGSDSSLNNTGKVNITGKATFTAAGTVTIFGIELQTNSDFLLAVTGSAASIVNLNNCYLNCVNNTGISHTSSNASAAVSIFYCGGNLGTTGIAYHSMSSIGNITYYSCVLGNGGVSTTVTSNSAGAAYFYYCSCPCPVGSTSTGGINLFNSSFDSSANNATALTANGSGTSVALNCFFSGGSASAVTVGVGATLNYVYCLAASSNTNAVTGAGSIQLTAPGFSGSSSLINTTSQTGGLLFGRKDGTAPNAGIIGERISNSATAVSMSNTTPTNITSINLTAGVWDISGLAYCNQTGTGSAFLLGISATSATITGTLGDQSLQQTYALSAFDSNLSIPAFRVTLSTTTTYYLVGESNFSSGSSTANGRISATRVG